VTLIQSFHFLAKLVSLYRLAFNPTAIFFFTVTLNIHSIYYCFLHFSYSTFHDMQNTHPLRHEPLTIQLISLCYSVKASTMLQ